MRRRLKRLHGYWLLAICAVFVLATAVELVLYGMLIGSSWPAFWGGLYLTAFVGGAVAVVEHIPRDQL